jgi:HSP20 family protein
MPSRDLDDFQRQIQELFNDLWQMPRFAGLHRGFRPEADCYRTDDPPELHVIVELPGVDPDHVQVVVSGRALLIAGVREPTTAAGSRVLQLELRHGQFQRQIQLPEEVDSAHASASYDRGLLRITLPVAPASPAQERVAITVRRRA